MKAFLKNYTLLMFGIFLSLYFVYHIFYGKRGYLYLMKVREDKAQAQMIADEIHQHKRTLEHRVKLLSNSSLDLDMLDEMARVHLNMAEKDDYIILIE